MTAPAVTTPAGIVLAAGAGRRFGSPKALATLGGRTLLARAVGTAMAGGCAPVIAVVGAAEDAVAAEALANGAVVAPNADWASGMGSSLRAGLAAAAANPAAAILLVDQPMVTAEAVRRVVAAWRAGATAGRATYAETPGHPVVLDRSTYADVAAVATGDAGAREWLRRNASLVVDVACDGAGDAADVDTADQLAALAARVRPCPPRA